MWEGRRTGGRWVGGRRSGKRGCGGGGGGGGGGGWECGDLPRIPIDGGNKTFSRGARALLFVYLHHGNAHRSDFYTPTSGEGGTIVHLPRQTFRVRFLNKFEHGGVELSPGAAVDAIF
ncbi:unnamed protein product [Pleuronectes platessa]|uniref:Uncharacterized protein n=1 Tax=Pleuronectes platessa TaxID=8262 RepID=A0A9N7Y7F9_PLEPL|nr:unnamed protein product [Pleuronectes platessa]